MRFAYADPPYLGLCSYYGHEHGDGGCWDEPETHRRLIERLVEEFPDGWAMSLHSPALQTILPMCPSDVRVLAWVKTFASFKPGTNPGYAWEPVVLRGGRKYGRGHLTVTDWVAERVTLQRGFVGAKPDRVVWWLFACLNTQPDDEFVDLFPGSGAVARAWETWRRQAPIALEVPVARSARSRPLWDDV